jgi:hypothetical protein
VLSRPFPTGTCTSEEIIMADQKNRGGQKQGSQNPQQPEQAQGANTGGAGERGDRDKRQDQRTNPDGARREPTDQKR